MRRGIELILVVSLAACSGPTLDMSSMERAESSLAEVAATMPDRADDVRSAYEYLAFSGMGSMFGAFADAMETLVTREPPEFLQWLDGSTAEALLSAATDSAMAGWERREADLNQRVDSLSALVASVDAVRAELETVRVTSANVRSVPQQYGPAEKAVRLTIVNGSARPLSRLFFQGVLRSEGRSVPWLDTEFNYSIPGGIEPGETMPLNLVPNRFDSDWDAVDQAPASAAFEVTVVNASAADGEQLIDALADLREERLADAQAALATALESLQELRAGPLSFREGLQPPVF